MPLRILIVDDHEIVREGLTTLLSEEPDIQVIGQAADGLQAITLAAELQPDVILMDVVMPEVDGIQATQRVRVVSPDSQIIVLTSFGDDQYVRRAIQVGALGYLLKDVQKPELLRAIRAAAEGKPTLHPEAQQALMRQISSAPPHTNLTERELEVLCLIAQGKSNKEIAAQLFLTEGTVKGYVSSIFDKLGVADRTQAAIYALNHHLIDAR